MHFRAQIKRGSAIDKMWRGHNRLGGEVSGVLFSVPAITVMSVYTSKELEAGAVVGLRDNPNIELVATGVPLPESEPTGDDIGNGGQEPPPAPPAPVEPEIEPEKEPEPSSQEPVSAEPNPEPAEPEKEPVVEPQEHVVEQPKTEIKNPSKAQSNKRR